MSKSKILKFKHRKAIFFEILGAIIFLSGVALYFQPVGQELFTLYIRFPVVLINFAPGGVMIVGALMWAYGESNRLEAGGKIVAEDLGAEEALRKERRKNKALSLCYLIVLLLIAGLMVQDFIGSGLVFKNILMFGFFAITVGAKFLLHRTQN